MCTRPDRENTPPMMAHTDVKNSPSDGRLSVKLTLIGESSYVKYTPGGLPIPMASAIPCSCTLMLSVTLNWLVDMRSPLIGTKVVGTTLRKYWWMVDGAFCRDWPSSGLTAPGNPSPNASFFIVCVMFRLADCTANCTVIPPRLSDFPGEMWNCPATRFTSRYPTTSHPSLFSFLKAFSIPSGNWSWNSERRFPRPPNPIMAPRNAPCIIGLCPAGFATARDSSSFFSAASVSESLAILNLFTLSFTAGSMGMPSEFSRRFKMCPSWTSICRSPLTSVVSRVIREQETRGNVMSK
mmetsp:Transcript_24844/g.41531  ORF Transcript_24844/g.41531 Transcript_24844/m.41531 type:complete len:295 (+) Transcript_24844:332-1216(+)